MAVCQEKYKALSEVNPDFAPLIPLVNKVFGEIWTYENMEDFRGNWTKKRASYPNYVPTEGFDISHQLVHTSDGAEVEIRLYTPIGSSGHKLPLLFVLHGGG